MRVFGIVGWKNSGKTTLVTRLVAHFTAQGLTVSTIKHSSDDFAIDIPGTDTFRHSEGGAAEVAIVSGERFALMRNRGEAETLESMLARLAPCDLVLVEGFKRASIPKLQAMGPAARQHDGLWTADPMIRGVAGEPKPKPDLPIFQLDAISDIAKLVLSEAQQR